MKRKLAVIVVVLTLITLSIFLGNRYINRPAETITYSGTIEGTELPVQPELSGRIVDLPVHEGQIIKAGDIVAKLDDSQAKISLDSAKVQQAQAQAKLDDLLGGARTEEIRRLKGLLAQANANAAGLALNVKYEDNTLTNVQKLENNALTQQKVDEQQNKLDTVKAQYQGAQANVNAVQASLDQAQAGNSQPTIKAQKAAVDIVAQSVKAAELALSKLTIKSPTSGQVLYKHVELGQSLILMICG